MKNDKVFITKIQRQFTTDVPKKNFLEKLLQFPKNFDVYPFCRKFTGWKPATFKELRGLCFLYFIVVNFNEALQIVST